MISYIDQRDSGIVILTHTYLLIGCAIPLWLHCRLYVYHGASVLPALCGVLILGIGDAMVHTFFECLKFQSYLMFINIILGLHYWSVLRSDTLATLSKNRRGHCGSYRIRSVDWFSRASSWVGFNGNINISTLTSLFRAFFVFADCVIVQSACYFLTNALVGYGIYIKHLFDVFTRSVHVSN